jgi:hypothetical protein
VTVVVLKTPEEITAYVLAHFDDVTEEQIGKFERDVAIACPNSYESGLLYALRVSKCVPTLKSFKTLNSRWGLAHSGTRGDGGFVAATRSPNYQATHDFLAKRYGDRVEELCREIVAKAENAAANRKTESARCNVLYAAREKIEKAYYLVAWVPEPWAKQRAWIAYLDGEWGACDGCGQFHCNLKKSAYGQLLCATCLDVSRGQ